MQRNKTNCQPAESHSDACPSTHWIQAPEVDVKVWNRVQRAWTRWSQTRGLDRQHKTTRDRVIVSSATSPEDEWCLSRPGYSIKSRQTSRNLWWVSDRDSMSGFFQINTGKPCRSYWFPVSKNESFCYDRSEHEARAQCDDERRVREKSEQPSVTTRLSGINCSYSGQWKCPLRGTEKRKSLILEESSMNESSSQTQPGCFMRHCWWVTVSNIK